MRRREGPEVAPPKPLLPVPSAKQLAWMRTS